MYNQNQPHNSQPVLHYGEPTGNIDYDTQGSFRSYSSHGNYIEPVSTMNGTDTIDDGESQMKPDDKYRYERHAINDAQSVPYTAYTMNQDNDIVHQLRNVGVTVLSLESLSTAALMNYMDAITTMRLGNGDDEKCMLYIVG